MRHRPFLRLIGEMAWRAPNAKASATSLTGDESAMAERGDSTEAASFSILEDWALYLHISLKFLPDAPFASNRRSADLEHKPI